MSKLVQQPVLRKRFLPALIVFVCLHWTRPDILLSVHLPAVPLNYPKKA